MFDANKIELPKDLPGLMDAAAKIQKDTDAYGIAVRGSRSWATIHPGFLSGYANYGAKDFVMEGGHLKAAMNSPEAKAFTELWVKMIQDSGPKNWATYTWYQVGNDLGAGATGMIFDADILGYFQNTGDTKEKGNIGFHAFAAKPGATAPTPNVWIWSLAMSSFSQQKDAAWYWLQWATSKEHDLFGGVKMQAVDPARQSVWDDAGFKAKMASSAGYLEQFQASAPGSKIYFTPQPLFFNVTTDWAAALQRMVANQVPVDEGLDQLVDSINKQMEQAGL
jgi:multiple sugar transport system substrate-binding protein